MNLELKDKKVLVLGSSAGIGKAIAKTFVDEGARVCLNSRSLDKIEKVKEELGAHSTVVADLSQAGEGKKATQLAIEKMGGLDILILNTGGPPKASFEETSLEVWNEQFQNLWLSSVEAMQVAFPEMKKLNYGRVIFITSVAAKEAMDGLTVSNGLRAGLHGLMRSISNEVAKDGITLNALLPGFTNTERLAALNLSESFVKAKVPAGRLGEPEELGDLCAFLCSPKASYITSQTIAIDGGYLNGL